MTNQLNNTQPSPVGRAWRGLLSLAPLAAVPVVAQQQEQPNIVVIVADDMGTNEIGCYGGTNVTTPNIDRLADEGMMFTNNYASMA